MYYRIHTIETTKYSFEGDVNVWLIDHGSKIELLNVNAVEIGGRLMAITI